MSQYPDCSGKVALVTGAAGGIGAAVASRRSEPVSDETMSPAVPAVR